MDGIEINAHLDPWLRHVQLYFGLCERSSQKLFHGEIDWQEIPENSVPPGPTVSITMEQAQRLMDRLWTCGLRPSEGTGSAGALNAVERHLEDMRTIAFRGLGMDLKKE